MICETFLALLQPSAHRSIGAEVVLLVTPKCALDKNADLQKVPCQTLKAKGLRVAAGASAADAKPAGECYVIELGPTNNKTENFTAQVFLDSKPNVATPVTYPRVRLLQPYKLWYFKDATATAQVLGDGFSFIMETPVETIANNRVRIGDEKAPELTKRGMINLCKNLPNHVQHALAQKIVLGQATRMSQAQVPGVYNTPRESDLYRNADRPWFRAGKVTYQKDGTATIEMPLHNRLPVRAAGTLRREETAQERLARVKIGGDIALNRPESEMKFDLQAGEKQVLKFTVLAPLVVRGLPEQSTFEVRSLVLGSK